MNLSHNWATIHAVTVGSIRWRILKAITIIVPHFSGFGYSGLDPMEDTESS